MALGTATGLSREGLQYGSGVTGSDTEKATAARQSAQARGGDDGKKKKVHAYSGLDIASSFEKADAAGKAAIQEKRRLAARGVDLSSLYDRVFVVVPNLFAVLMAKDPEMELAF